jgi:uncharacterized protein YecE (DUF72 family)
LRKTEYTDDELQEWAGRIQPALDGDATIFCYFKHEDEGASPKMAKRLEEALRRRASEAISTSPAEPPWTDGQQVSTADTRQPGSG